MNKIGRLIVITLFLLLAFLVTSGGSMKEPSRIVEIPERYREKPDLLLTDYQSGILDEYGAIQILILKSLEEPGVFLPMYETDTRMDYYYIDKNRHEYLQRMKSELYRKFNK